jgi:hypothetical protein
LKHRVHAVRVQLRLEERGQEERVVSAAAHRLQYTQLGVTESPAVVAVPAAHPLARRSSVDLAERLAALLSAGT